MSLSTFDRIDIRAQSAPWSNGVEFLVSSGRAILETVTFKDVEDGIIRDPSFRLDRSQAQTLMDDLWNAGFRPTEGSGSAGSLRATEKHLEDMRRLVFKTQ